MAKKRLTTTVDEKIIEELKFSSIRTGKSVGDIIEEMWKERKEKEEQQTQK